MDKIIRIGTRKSNLALAQTNEVVEQLKIAFPDYRFEIVKISSKGDVINEPLYLAKEKGIFVKAIDEKILEGEIDIAVHSLKDYPLEIHEELVIASIPKRRSPYDALVPSTFRGIEEIPSNSVVGSSSIRRISHIKYFRKDLEIKNIRGNVDTRVGKIGKGYDAIILAEAGLERLGLMNYIRIPAEIITPQAGQGALAIVTRKGSYFEKILSKIEDRKSRIETELERKALEMLGGGCRAPLGIIAELNHDGKVRLMMSIVSPDFQRRIFTEIKGNIGEMESLLKSAIQRFSKEGGVAIAEEWRKGDEE